MTALAKAAKPPKDQLKGLRNAEDFRFFRSGPCVDMQGGCESTFAFKSKRDVNLWNAATKGASTIAGVEKRTLLIRRASFVLSSLVPLQGITSLIDLCLPMPVKSTNVRVAVAISMHFRVSSDKSATLAFMKPGGSVANFPGDRVGPRTMDGIIPPVNRTVVPGAICLSSATALCGSCA